jgi:hypothetical protein
MENASDVRVSARISRAHYEKILEIQKEAKKKTGYTPTVSTVIRTMIEDAPGAKKR